MPTPAFVLRLAAAIKGGWLRAYPGIVVSVAIAAIAHYLTSRLPPPFGVTLIALALGAAVGNLLPNRERLVPGLLLARGHGLRLGIVLLGAQVTIADVARTGRVAFGAVAFCLVFAIVLVVMFSRFLGVSRNLTLLIAVGTAICGNTAIVAASPILGAEDEEISFAVGTITIFGTLALLVFPLTAVLFDIPELAMGYWTGLAVNDTSQVVAVGAAHSAVALEIATVVKLLRNSFLAPVLMILAAIHASRPATPDRKQAGALVPSIVRAFPMFVFGFLGMAVARSLGVVDSGLAQRLGDVTHWLVATAIAAVGMGTIVSTLRRIGVRPFLVGLGAAALLSSVALVIALSIGH